MIKNIFLITIFLIGIAAFTEKGTAFAASAADNYKFYCTQCHGEKGDGTGVNANPAKFGLEGWPEMSVTPRNHTSQVDMDKLSDEDVKQAITGGGASVSKSSLMPPWGKTLTEDEIKDLVAHLRGLCKCKGK